jgi:hypothetical protein
MELLVMLIGLLLVEVTQITFLEKSLRKSNMARKPETPQKGVES